MTYFALGTLDFSADPYGVLNEGTALPEPALKDSVRKHFTGDPDPAWWPYDWHENATRVFRVECVAGTAACAVDLLMDLRAAAKPGATLYARPTDQTETFSTLVYDATVNVEEYGELLRGQGHVRATMTLTTYPYWVGMPTTACGTVSSVPGTFVVCGVSGDVPALTAVKATCTQATSGIFLGLRSNASACASFWQDYCGSAAYASYSRTGESACAAMTTCAALVGTGQALSSKAMTGTYAPIARVLTTACSTSSTKYAARSSVDALVLTSCTSYNTDTKASTKTVLCGFETIVLPDVEVPAGNTANTGLVAWGACAVMYANACGTALACAVYGYCGFILGQSVNASGYSLCQTFTPACSCAPDSVIVKIRATAACGVALGALIAEDRTFVSGDYIAFGDTGTICGTYDGTVTIPLRVISGKYLAQGTRYRLWLWLASLGKIPSDEAALQGYYSCGTACGSLIGVDGNCLYTTLYGRGEANFTSNVNLLAASACACLTYLDTMTYLPVDESAVIAQRTFTACTGIYLDWTAMADTSRDVYVAGGGTGEIGASIIGNTSLRSPFYLRPGDNTIVCQAATPANAAPTAMTVLAVYYPRYLSLAGGT